MQRALTTTTGIVEIGKPSLAGIGKVAKQVARQHVLRMYQETLAPNTIKRQRCDLQVFAQFLQSAGETISVDALLYDLSTWAGCTDGLLESFKMWMLEEGYSIGSVNVRLSTAKKYCELAAKANFVDAPELGLIKTVYGYRGKEGRNVDTKRATTRVGNKKASPVTITVEQADQLLAQEDSRDALLMYLLLRLGFRVGEISALEVSNVDLEHGYVALYRQKTDLNQTHELRWQGHEIMRRYLEEYHPAGKLFTGKEKLREDNSVSTDYTIRSIQKRVKALGRKVGIDNLSPHDCRHYMATWMARNKTHIKSMQDALGHSTPFMSLRYVESSSIANEGVIL